MIRGICSQEEALSARDAERIASIADSVRRPIVVEHVYGRSWDRYDQAVGMARDHGLHFLPVFVWDTNGSMRPTTSELRSRFANFIEEAVYRYEFESVEVTNEANLWPFALTPGCTATPVIRVLEQVRRQIPDTKIILGGLTPKGKVHSLKWMRRAYKLELRFLVDEIAFHPYHATAPECISLVRGMRTVMRENRHDVPMWLTEFGWGTHGTSGLEGTAGRVKSERGQALETMRFLDLIEKEPKIAGTWLYQLNDEEGESWADRAGIFRMDGTPKQLYESLRQSAERKAA